MVIDLSTACTQQALAGLVGVSQQAVSALQAEGKLPAGLTLGQTLLAYCERLREQAAGRLGSGVGGLDLAQERAALAKAQREAVELKTAVMRGQYADVSLLTEVLAGASQAVADRFDHLPGLLKRACPQLAAADRDHVVAVIACARNEWVRATAELVSQRIMDIDEAPAEGLEVGDPEGSV